MQVLSAVRAAAKAEGLGAMDTVSKLYHNAVLMGLPRSSFCRLQDLCSGFCDVQVLSAIRAAAKTEGLSAMDIVSKPYHDAALMGVHVPTAMIFVPCRDGLSHHPDEYASPKAVQVCNACQQQNAHTRVQPDMHAASLCR